MKKFFVALIFIVVFVISSVVSVCAGSLFEFDKDDFYFLQYKNKKIELLPSLTSFSVKLSGSDKFYFREISFKRLPTLEEYLKIIKEANTTGLFFWSEKIDLVLPVFYIEGRDKDFLLTDKIIIFFFKLKTTKEAKKFVSRISGNQIVVLEKELPCVKYCNEFILKIQNTSEKNPLEWVHIIKKEKETQYIQPVFERDLWDIK